MAIDRARRLKRYPVQALDILSAEPEDQRDEEAANQERREQLHTLLHAWMEEVRAKHPINYRLLYGHFFEGHQVKELAAAEGLSENAASHRIQRTIQLLREWASRRREEELES